MKATGLGAMKGVAARTALVLFLLIQSGAVEVTATGTAAPTLAPTPAPTWSLPRVVGCDGEYSGWSDYPLGAMGWWQPIEPVRRL